MEQRVNNHEKTVIKRGEPLENARFSNTSFNTHHQVNTLILNSLLGELCYPQPFHEH